MAGNQVIEDLSSNDVIVPFLQKTAQDLNLGVMFPVLNLQDPNQIKANVVCDLDVEAIQKASKNYQARAVVAGCLTQKNSSWHGDWLLLHDNSAMHLSFSGTTPEDVITQTLHEISKDIGVAPAALPAVQDVNGAIPVVLRVTGISGLDQYAGIVKYLHTFSQIKQVDVQSVSINEMLLRVGAIGGKQVLVSALSAQKQLIPDGVNGAVPAGIDLSYKWVN